MMSGFKIVWIIDVDALSRKAVGQVSCLIVTIQLATEMERFSVEVYSHNEQGVLASLTVEPTLISWTKAAQKDDGELWAIQQQVQDRSVTDFQVDNNGVVWFRHRLCVPNNSELREVVLKEAHDSPLAIHPGSTKMYHDLKQYFWWSCMKRDIAEYMSRCLTCQLVKIEH